MTLQEIEAALAAKIAENQELGRQQDAIRDQRTALRKEIDALIVARHQQIALASVTPVVAPGAVVEATNRAVN